jgi:hypothetical protein
VPFGNGSPYPSQEGDDDVINGLKLTRRSTLKLAGAGAAAVVVARTGCSHALAQQSEGSALAALGLPELNITISDTGYAGLDSELSAGMYLIHAENTGSGPGFIEFMQLPEGMTAADLTAMLGGGGDESTPIASAEDEVASPAAGQGGEDQGPPEWYYTVYLAGGAGVGPGQTAHFVLNLAPGNYVVWGEGTSDEMCLGILLVTRP